MTNLARKLRLVDYFVLAFGVMVGTAWLVIMDDILVRGGPLGAILGFTFGALMLLPIGYVYSQLVPVMPDPGAEAVYVAGFVPPSVSFITGWLVILSYFLTCPFEALAMGRIGGYIFPILNTIPLYELGGRPVYLPHILVGLFVTIVLTWINYRGIHTSAAVARWTTFTFLTLVALFSIAGISHGRIENLQPLFAHSPLVSTLLVWQIVPWLLGGFESVGKYAEEGVPELPHARLSIAIIATILAGLGFFWIVISAVSFVAPWQTLRGNLEFPTAMVFERALHTRSIVILVMVTALVSSVQAFNANMVTSSRLLFGMGRRAMANYIFGSIHASYKTPAVAIIGLGVTSAALMFLGDAGLVPILELGAGASAVCWLAGCAAYWHLRPPLIGRLAALFGMLVTIGMIVVKLVPLVPGHFTRYEWIALAAWLALGMLIRASGKKQPAVRANEAKAV
jgi:amino acid transporter